MSITEPGIYPNVDETAYHADVVLAPKLGRSLSASGAKILLRSPAKFHYERSHPTPATDAMDVGTVTHELILRSGDKRINVIDSDTWRGNAGKKRDEIRARKHVAVHRKQLREAAILAAAVRRNPLAAAILSEGIPEQSIYWVDEGTGVTRRGRIDWLRPNAIVDVKTCVDASPGGFAKAVANLDYHMAAAWYIDGIAALTGEERPFLFIAVEKEPPYLTAVYQLDNEALTVGRQRNRRALESFAECESSGVWPGYSDDIETVSLPRWATY